MNNLHELLELQSENKTLKAKDQINTRLLKHKSEQIAGMQRVLSQYEQKCQRLTWLTVYEII